MSASSNNKNISFPVLVVINGKRYSPSSFPPSHSHLRFALSLHHEPGTGCPELKLHMLAPRDLWPAVNPGRFYDHPISFFFPAGGLFNYNYRRVAEPTGAVVTRFGVPVGETGEKDTRSGNVNDSDSDKGSSWRVLEFGAEEMAVGASAMKGVPRLRNKEAEALVKRLLGTVKNAIEEPIAVLEVKCLIYDADADTDAAISALEEALMTPPTNTPPGTSSPSKQRSPIKNWRHLKIRYKDAQEAKPAGFRTSTSSSTINNRDHIPESAAVQPPKAPSRSPSNSPQKNMFRNNSPPTLRFLTPGKRVCFNCYAVGHREDVCDKPKRILGNRQGTKKNEKRKGGKKGGGGTTETGAEDDDDDDVFVDKSGIENSNRETNGARDVAEDDSHDGGVKASG